MSQDELRVAEELLSAADQQLLHGEYREAEAKAQEAIGILELSDDERAIESSAAFAESNTLHTEINIRLSLAYHIIGTCARFQTDVNAAHHYYERSLHYSQESGVVKDQARALGNLGVTKSLLDNSVEDVEFTMRALELDTSIDNKSGMAMWHNNLGITSGKLGDYTKALEHFIKAVDLDEQAQSTNSRATKFNNIGIVYEHLGDYLKALEYFERSIGIDESLANKKGIAMSLSNMAMAYSHLGDSEQAIECLRRALSIDQELGNKRGCAIRLSNLADEFASGGELELALEYQSKALEIDRELDNTRGCGLRLASIGMILAKRRNSEDDLESAEAYLLEGMALSEKVGHKHHLFSCHKELAKLYEIQGRVAESLEHFKKFYELEREVLSQQAKQSARKAEQQRAIREREKQFEVAQAKTGATVEATKKLLYRLLPTVIADRIIDGEEQIADYFPSVSILFADIKGFTGLSATLPANVVVQFLQHIFREFDRVMKKHGCEKIKTIGDGYMAVAGAPVECVDHAERLTAAALEIQQTIALPEGLREHLPKDIKFGVRIGLHTGSIIAGVIGEERFLYDIYSDAVNTASRMESYGEENKIHVSHDFYQHLVNRLANTGNSLHGISFEQREEMEIKGKGMMRTYFLEQA